MPVVLIVLVSAVLHVGVVLIAFRVAGNVQCDLFCMHSIVSELFSPRSPNLSFLRVNEIMIHSVIVVEEEVWFVIADVKDCNN